MRVVCTLRSVLIGAVATALLATGGAAARADDDTTKKHRVDAAVADLQDALDDTSTELRRATSRLLHADEKLVAAKTQLRMADDALTVAQARQNDLEARLKVARSQVTTSQKHLDRVHAQIDAGRDAAGGIARTAYTSGQLGNLAVIMESQSPSDFVSRMAMLQSAARGQGALLDSLATDRADVTNETARLAAARDRVSGLEKQSEAVVRARTDAQDKASSAKSDATDAQRTAETAQAEIQVQKDREVARLASMRAEQARLGDLLRKAAQLRKRRAAAAKRAAAARRAAGRAAVSGGLGHSSGLMRPNNGDVTSPFGMRMHPVLHVQKLHDGTDFAGACGSPIRAAADGTVAWAEWLNGYGFQTGIDHGTINGRPVATSYSHQPYLSVHVGQFVHQGDIIGVVGDTGYATGCHIHFMVYVNGQVVDPQNGWV